MSLADLLGYNFQVVKTNHITRGILIAASIILLLGLMVSSDWTPLIRLLNKSKSALNSGDIMTASFTYAQAAHYSPEKFELLENAGILAMVAGNLTAS